MLWLVAMRSERSSLAIGLLCANLSQGSRFLICWRHASSASASLPYLSPDQEESREAASSTGENAVHPKQPQILANQRLACVVAGLVKLACFGFDSHALPPRDPEPYGHWLDVYMEVNPLLQANVGPAELARSAGGRYETV